MKPQVMLSFLLCFFWNKHQNYSEPFSMAVLHIKFYLSYLALAEGSRTLICLDWSSRRRVLRNANKKGWCWVQEGRDGPQRWKMFTRRGLHVLPETLCPQSLSWYLLQRWTDIFSSALVRFVWIHSITVLKYKSTLICLEYHLLGNKIIKC